MAQEFKTVDVLRLEVAYDPGWPVNLAVNPGGDLGVGAWGWIPAGAGSLKASDVLGPVVLRYSTGGEGSEPDFFYTEPMQVLAGQYAAASWNLQNISSSTYYRASLEWLDSSLTVLSASTPTGYLSAETVTTYGSHLAPAGTTAFRLRFDISTNTGTPLPSGRVFDVNEVVAAVADTAGELADLSDLDPVPYVDVLGPTHDIKVTREALNTGTLTATILDASLDPSTADTIRPGRHCRLVGLFGDGSWRPFFTGKVASANVTYEYKRSGVPDPKRARIELTAVDNLATLANTKRTEGVATIDELPHVLQGCGVPWNCNGNVNNFTPTAIVALNENASAVDQVAITRDTNLGYAWVDHAGVFQVHDADDMSPIWLTVGPGDYTDLDLSYNTEDCVNEVNLTFLRHNPSTGETEEVAYGPYRDEASIATWGVRSATYTVQGIAEETADLADYADAILTANSTPAVRVNSITRTLTTDTHVASATNSSYWDLYGGLGVVVGEEDPVHLRITAIEHTITPEKWLVRYSLTQPTTVAAPTFTPSPQTGAGGKTIGQLLRPVGEVTMWFGASADVPAGWLLCDGSAFSGTDYPDLEDLLGGTTLPNFTDRFPIGAGTKALGTSGGNNTVTLTQGNLPSVPIRHTSNTEQTGAGIRVTNIGDLTGGGGSAATLGSSNPVNVLNPWRALWFIIRAR
ncbi:microcystin-dependent protein [Mumia flava]|uniref:Microcystin-dependent protein n=1 Tax=Mumia flava TaxID=1348852 RepID=A0A0B2BT43_9ACTN|nr:tail fiber protein [Mumia flava]PJJ48295.1 microcystin-dependent protein [Mumia flava]